MIRSFAPVLIASFFAAEASGAQPPGPDGRTIVGSVRFRGQPAVGATVGAKWQVAGASEEVSSDLPVVTDSEGRFTLKWCNDPKARPYVIFARDQHGRLGWLDIRGQLDLSEPPGQRVELNEIADTRGRLTDATGSPLRQTRIRARYVTLGVEETAQSIQLPPELEKAYETITDEEGRFILKGVPAGGRVSAEVMSPAFGNPRLLWPQHLACEARLEKAGSIRVRFEGVADHARLKGFKWHGYAMSGEDVARVRVLGEAVLVGEGKETQTLTNLTPGRYKVYTGGDWSIPYLADNPIEIDVPADGVGEVTIKMAPAAEVRGRVIDAKTQKGIPGVRVNITKPHDQGHRQIFAWTNTGADGRFLAYVTPGNLAISLRHVSGTVVDGYPPPPENQQPITADVAASESHTFADLALVPAVPIDGIVVDDSGKALPWITIQTAHIHQRIDGPVSDRNGRFRLLDLGPDEVTALRARTASGTTDGAIHVDVEKQKGPVKLVVSDANAFRLRGRVSDPDGKPIVDATARIEWRYQGVGRSSRWGIGGFGGRLFTDPDGRFESIALWPGDEYRVQVEAPGYGKVESDLVKGVAGQSHDFGSLKLPRTAGRVSGMIVDARNQSIKGVRVFNNGDGPKPVSTISGDDGRFTLDGLFDGEVYVFAQKEGYRFTGKLTKSGEQEVYVTMLAADAPPPKNQPNPQAAEYVAARKKLTRHLLQQMWNQPVDSPLAEWRSQVLDGMARIDLEQANRWVDELRKRGEHKAPYTGIILFATAQKIAAADVDAALPLLAPLGGREGHARLIEIVRPLIANDPDKARRLLEEAVVKARATQVPDRAWMLARVGEMMVQVGQRETGRKLLFEAADIAEGLGVQRMHGYARGFVAARLAPFDLPRAKRLLLQGDESERRRWVGVMAERLSTHDLDHAMKLLDEFKADQSSFTADTHRAIAVRLAKSGRIDEAVKIAQGSLQDPFRPGTALAAVAVAVAKTDPRVSRSLIDQTFDLYLRPSTFLTRRTFDTLPVFAAYQARAANYPDMQSVVGRVLSCRQTSDYDSPNRIAELHAEMAMLLALVDPATAKWLLNRAVPPGPIHDEISKKRSWLFMVALADPERAIGEIDRRIAAAKDSLSGQRNSGLSELVRILSQPTEDLLVRELIQFAGVNWPRDDD